MRRARPLRLRPDLALDPRLYRGFREYWTRLSGPPKEGRPPISPEIVALVRTVAAANPLWGAPRIHGELLKLGLAVSERTVSRLIPKPSRALSTSLLKPG